MKPQNYLLTVIQSPVMAHEHKVLLQNGPENVSGSFCHSAPIPCQPSGTAHSVAHTHKPGNDAITPQVQPLLLWLTLPQTRTTENPKPSHHLTSAFNQFYFTFCLLGVQKLALCAETHLTNPTHEACVSMKPGCVICGMFVVSLDARMQQWKLKANTLPQTNTTCLTNDEYLQNL